MSAILDTILPKNVALASQAMTFPRIVRYASKQATTQMPHVKCARRALTPKQVAPNASKLVSIPQRNAKLAKQISTGVTALRCVLCVHVYTNQCSNQCSLPSQKKCLKFLAVGWLTSMYNVCRFAFQKQHAKAMVTAAQAW